MSWMGRPHASIRFQRFAAAHGLVGRKPPIVANRLRRRSSCSPSQQRNFLAPVKEPIICAKSWLNPGGKQKWLDPRRERLPLHLVGNVITLMCSVSCSELISFFFFFCPLAHLMLLSSFGFPAQHDIFCSEQLPGPRGRPFFWSHLPLCSP